MSTTATQYAPATSGPLSWAVVLADVVVDPPDRIEQPPVELGLPIANPIVIVAGGPADTSVTLTVPATATVNGWMSAWKTPATGKGTVPVNVSVTPVPVGRAMVPELPPPPQAAAATSSSASPTAVKGFISSVSQFVTDASNGVNIARILTVVRLDSPAKPAHEGVDAS